MTPMGAKAIETVPEGAFDMILRTTEALGPLGAVFFVVAVVVCECIPLFPTTPLSLASGILFGAQKGAICILGGTTTASIIAFAVARGIGRPLAEKIISAEMSSDEDAEETMIQKKLHEIEHVIEQGTFWQQAAAVLALRLTPIVPFSASNYVLGLSPLPFLPYITGTVAGMCFWSILYASIGSASRILLSRGMDPDVLLGELLEATGKITGKAGIAVVLGLTAAAAVYLAVNNSSSFATTTNNEKGDDGVKEEKNGQRERTIVNQVERAVGE